MRWMTGGEQEVAQRVPSDWSRPAAQQVAGQRKRSMLQREGVERQVSGPRVPIRLIASASQRSSLPADPFNGTHQRPMGAQRDQPLNV
jgi:capsid protein